MATALPPILPVGTAVVAIVDLRGSDGRVSLARGAAGIITVSPADPDHSYRVRFPGGEEHSLRRRDMQVLSHYQARGLDPQTHRLDPMHEYDLYQHVVYRVIVGSRAFGLEHADSDTDRRGVYLPPARMHWSIYGVPEQLENPDTEECYWELQKFVTLALKANPNVLEVLYVPDDCIELAQGIGARLRAERSIFLSRLVYQTFNGYAMSQFDKLRRDIENKGAMKNKHAMHLIRLLHAGIEALQTGELPVRVHESHRAQLLAIRDGQMSWEDIDELRVRLHRDFDGAFAATKLPERPDFDRANALVIEARRAMAAGEAAS